MHYHDSVLEKTSLYFDKKIAGVFHRFDKVFIGLYSTQKKLEQSINLSVSENNLTVFLFYYYEHS